ncbi:MAG: hypothetical protein WB797_08685 [Nocardioides sp.]
MTHRSYRPGAAAAVLVTAIALLCTSGPVLSTASATPHVAPRTTLKPGKWTPLGLTTQAGTPAVWQSPSRTTYILWKRLLSGNDSTYEIAGVSAKGKVSAPADVFKSAHWASLSGAPTLVAAGSHPLVVFNGTKGTSGMYHAGCVYGALDDASPWTPQPWVLSGDCANPVGPGAEDKNGVLAAAWPGGWSTGHGVEYRIGTTSYPAGTDSRIGVPLGVGVGKVGIAADTAGNDHFWVGWTETDNAKSSKNGYYVKDVTAGSASRKMPGTGTLSVSPHLGVFANLAMTNRGAHGGVYVAACTNTNTCTLKLWRVGARKAVTVPHSKDAADVGISPGPGGRIWVSWYGFDNKVRVTRSNAAVTHFGRVRTFRTPCFENGDLGLSGGSSPRLVVAMQCVNKKTKIAEYVTETTAALSLKASAKTVKKGKKVTFTVSDAGDPVSGAKVTFEGHSGKTNSHGKVTLKAVTTGKAKAKATDHGYAAATVTIKVT